MAFRVRTVRDHDEFIAALSAIGHYFGWSPTDEDAGRFSRLLPLERMHAVFDDGRIVAGAGVFPFRMTVPGGDLACAGVTVVGVLPSHRRRGLLRRMMDAQLGDVRKRRADSGALGLRGDDLRPLRLRVGLILQLRRRADGRRDQERSSTRNLAAGGPRRGAEVLPRVYDRVAKRTPGMIVRSREWWSPDASTTRRSSGAEPAARTRLAERDGRPVGYALYRLAQDGSIDTWTKISSASTRPSASTTGRRATCGDSCSRSLADRISGYHLPLDHPLPLLVDRINKLRLSVWDALWCGSWTFPPPWQAGLRVAGARHGRDRVRSALPRERGLVDDRGRRSASRHAPPGRSRRRIWPRLDVPRWAVVRAARAGRARGASRTGRDREGGRAVPHVRRAMVPRDLLRAP